MELESSCTVVLDKGKKKVRCHKFMHKELKRELAVHEDVDHKHLSSITDVKTGLRLCGVQAEIKKVTLTQVGDMVDNFIRHFTLDEVIKEFSRLDGEKKK